MRKVGRYILKFLSIPVSEKLLFLEAVFFLFAAKILLLIFPFKFCLKLLNCRHCTQDQRSSEYLQRIKTSLDRANLLSFWKNICLVHSFAARWMLNRRGIQSVLSIGVAHDENKKLMAHAWITAGKVDMVRGNFGFLRIYSLN